MLAKDRELVEGPEDGGTLAVTQPVGGGPMQLWDLEHDAPAGEPAERIVPLGAGVVARYDERGAPRLERSSGEAVPLDPGLPDSFSVLPGSWNPLAFASWSEGVAVFDPMSGELLGPVMTVPDVPFADVTSISETPDATLVAITWTQPEEALTETAVFEIRTGELLVRGLRGPDRRHTAEGGQLIGMTADFALRYDVRTLEPVSALPLAAGGSKMLSVSADGRTLLNVGFSNVLTLYDLRTGIPIGTPLDSDAPGQRVLGGFLTADGETLLEALPDGIRVWDLRPAQQASHACALAGREFTEEEWSTYFPGEQQVATCAILRAESTPK